MRAWNSLTRERVIRFGDGRYRGGTGFGGIHNGAGRFHIYHGNPELSDLMGFGKDIARSV